MASTHVCATEDMCYYCFDVLVSKLDKRSPKPTLYPSIIPIAKVPVLLFVTWRKGKHADFESNHLRGCKGATSHPQPLDKMLERFALNSALEDTRFDPIQLSEVPDLWCGVSILHSFEECRDPLDWEIGKHGISIEFQVYDPSIRRGNQPGVKFHGSAIFLPSVAPQQGWTKEQTIVQLIRKAGYKGPIDWSNIAIRAVRHQSHSVHVSYADWIAQKTRSM